MPSFGGTKMQEIKPLQEKPLDEVMQLKLQMQALVNEIADLKAQRPKKVIGETVRLPKEKPAKQTFDGEQIIGQVEATTARAVNAGYMVNFNGSPRNYCVFVKDNWFDQKVKAGKKYFVTAHQSKHSGKLTHAIKLGRKATVYAPAKNK